MRASVLQPKLIAKLYKGASQPFDILIASLSDSTARSKRAVLTVNNR